MMRRVLAAILMLCALASCSRNPVEEHAFLMDTWCSITFYDRGDEELSDEAFAILEEISSSYDSAEVDSLLSGLRDLRSRDSQARQQLSGEGPMTNYTDSDTSIFSVVMGA